MFSMRVWRNMAKPINYKNPISENIDVVVFYYRLARKQLNDFFQFCLEPVECANINYSFRLLISSFTQARNNHGWQTADSDTVSTYQVSSVQLVTDKKLEAFDKA